MIAAEQAVFFHKLGDNEKALEMLETAYANADKYETRPDGEKYAPCWLSEIDDKREYICRTAADTAYDTLYKKIIEHRFAELFSENGRFESLLEKLKEKINNARKNRHKRTHSSIVENCGFISYCLSPCTGKCVLIYLSLVRFFQLFAGYITQ